MDALHNELRARGMQIRGMSNGDGLTTILFEPSMSEGEIREVFHDLTGKPLSQIRTIPANQEVTPDYSRCPIASIPNNSRNGIQLG
ncbi:MAG: hypothetical protein ACOYJ2_05085 [Rickettsiales bacterium]